MCQILGLQGSYFGHRRAETHAYHHSLYPLFMGEIKATMTAESRLGSMVVHAYNPSTWEIQDQPELCLKKAKTNKKDQVSRNFLRKQTHK